MWFGGGRAGGDVPNGSDGGKSKSRGAPGAPREDLLMAAGFRLPCGSIRMLALTSL